MQLTRQMIILITFAFVMSFAANAHAADLSKRVTLKIATLAPHGSSWMKQLQEAARAIAERSEGRLKLKIYAGGIVGDELDSIRKIRIGQLHGAVVTGIGLGIMQPAVRVLDLPFLFRSYDELDFVRERLGPTFDAKFEERGYVLLAWADVGWIHVFSHRPVTTKAELQVTKFWAWVDDPLAHKMFRELGVSGIPLSLPSVLPHLQTGLIDTAYGSPLAVLSLQWHAKVKYMSDLRIALANAAVVISKKTYDTLPPDLRKILQEESAILERKLVDQSRRDNEIALTVMKKHGLQITTMAPQLRQEMKDASQVVWKELAGTLYPLDLLDEVRTLLLDFRGTHDATDPLPVTP